MYVERERESARERCIIMILMYAYVYNMYAILLAIITTLMIIIEGEGAVVARAVHVVVRPQVQHLAKSYCGLPFQR